MKFCALLILCLLMGCANAHPRDYALRLIAANKDHGTVCSATAMGPHEIETAAHCLSLPLQTINGKAVKLESARKTGEDRVRATVSGITFKSWAKLGKVKVGDRVRFWGQPVGFAFIYREGHVVAIYPDGFVVDATVCRGDSGSGLFNDAGQLVGVVSAESNDYGCTFMAAR